jgi:transaldolase
MKMKYFLDSAKIEEIKYAKENWAIDGVTSNPKHVKRSGKEFFTVVKEFAETFKDDDFPISVEIDPHIMKAEKMISEAKKIAKLSDNFAIKIPCNEQGLIATKKLVEDGIKVNVTLVFSTSQALQVGRLGAAYCSPFIGWQEASGVDCSQFLSDLVKIYDTYDFDTEIIVAALRNGKQIANAAALGADITTAGFNVYKESFEHPFTDKGLKIFQNAWDETDIGEL